MDEFRSLLEYYWIIKDKDKELYGRIKRAYPKYRKFVTEQLGWRLSINERVIKLEKVPAYAQPFMGIQEFSEISDYCILCAVLTFLEDKEDDEQFLLSELVDMIEVFLKPHMDMDWTKFVQRKSLIRVLQYVEKSGMLLVYEGSSDNLSGGLNHEILYENTGLSRYFAISFDFDISSYASYIDFETERLQEVDADRGHFRVNRVYRQLVSSPAMYWQEQDDQDNLYVKNQRQWVQKYLDDYLGGNLHIHKNGVFFVMDEDDCFGGKYPRDAMISEVSLVLCTEIRGRVNEGVIVRRQDDLLELSQAEFKQLVSYCKEKYDCAWSKEYREMDIDKLTQEILLYMNQWMLARQEDDLIVIYPSTGKFTGRYPKDFKMKGSGADE